MGATRAMSSEGTGGTGKKYCVKCGKNTNHTTDDCWALREQLGLPLNEKQKAYLKKKKKASKKKK